MSQILYHEMSFHYRYIKCIWLSWGFFVKQYDLCHKMICGDITKDHRDPEWWKFWNTSKLRIHVFWVILSNSNLKDVVSLIMEPSLLLPLGAKRGWLIFPSVDYNSGMLSIIAAKCVLESGSKQEFGAVGAWASV